MSPGLSFDLVLFNDTSERKRFQIDYYNFQISVNLIYALLPLPLWDLNRKLCLYTNVVWQYELMYVRISEVLRC